MSFLCYGSLLFFQFLPRWGRWSTVVSDNNNSCVDRVSSTSILLCTMHGSLYIGIRPNSWKIPNYVTGYYAKFIVEAIYDESSSQDCFLHSSLALCDRFSLFNVQFDIFSLRHSTYSWHRSFCSPLNIYLIHVQVNLSFSWSLEPRCCSVSISASRDAFVFVRINTQFTCSRLQEYVLWSIA